MSDALTGLARRVLGDAAAARVTFAPLDGAPRAFAYEARGGALAIRATDASAAACALHDYLLRACGRRISWDTPLPLDLARLPDVAETRGRARVASGSYFNFCTFGYTAAFWDWPRWEREIDWMALHGVTLPLAMIGHEAVLHDVYTELGLSDLEARTFLGGPAYLPWQLMGCLDGFPSVLPEGWVERRAALGARIVARQRELGMTTVLPTFTGQVPAQLAGADTTERDWMGFTTHLLGVEDPRFAELTAAVVRAQRRRFGSDGLYASDPFIEMTPPSDEPAYLGALARRVLSGLRSADPDAVWVMQTWPFSYQREYWTDKRVAALLDAVPDDAMVLLDLWGERHPQWRRFDGFRGKRWVWCALHDFGGRCDLFGDVAAIRDELGAALACAEPPFGTGLAMEATETNHMIYELVADQAWAGVDDLTAWARAFATSRYGAPLEPAASAWASLLGSVYAAPLEQLEPLAHVGVVTSAPRYDAPAVAPWHDGAALLGAWRDLLAAAHARPDLVGAELGHDLVVVAASAMARAIDDRHALVVEAYARRDLEALTVAGARFLEAFVDLDALLDTRAELRLERWVDAARAAGGEVVAADARRLVSVWTTPAHDVLTDYSARLWSGLVGGYYRERWRRWVDGLTVALRDGREPDAAALDAELVALGERFLADGAAPIARPPAPDTLAVARALHERYALPAGVDGR